MDENQIRRALTKDAFASKYFKNVLAYDELPDFLTVIPAMYVVNTGPSWTQGNHWIVCYFPKNGHPMLFDSLGKKGSEYNIKIEQFLTINTGYYKFNSMRIQSPGSKLCGHYCLLFCYMISRGMSYENFMQYFGNDLKKNDAMVDLDL